MNCSRCGLEVREGETAARGPDFSVHGPHRCIERLTAEVATHNAIAAKYGTGFEEICEAYNAAEAANTEMERKQGERIKALEEELQRYKRAIEYCHHWWMDVDFFTNECDIARLEPGQGEERLFRAPTFLEAAELAMAAPSFTGETPLERRSKIAVLEAENAALKERLAAISSFAYGNVKLHNDSLNKSDIDKAIDSMVADIAALREDKARLDWLLENVEGDRETERIAAWLWDIAANLCPVDYVEAHDTQKWGRKAIDAARKEAPDAKD